jgi:hypothetical protein
MADDIKMNLLDYADDLDRQAGEHRDDFPVELTGTMKEVQDTVSESVANTLEGVARDLRDIAGTDSVQSRLIEAGYEEEELPPYRTFYHRWLQDRLAENFYEAGYVGLVIFEYRGRINAKFEDKAPEYGWDPGQSPTTYIFPLSEMLLGGIKQINAEIKANSRQRRSRKRGVS